MILQKYGLLLLLALSLSIASLAQKRAKYEDVLPEILKMDRSNAIATLKSYLEEDAEDNASQNLQLGLIYHARFADSDPLKQYKRAMANIALTKDVFAKARPFIDEKETKKNEENYINFGQLDKKGKLTVSPDTILSTMDEYLAIDSAFETHVPAIYEAFTSSYINYSKASNLFSEIVGEYRTLKDLYLLHDEELSEKFGRLKSLYQESLEKFDVYKNLTKEYPVGYNQQLQIEKIDIYRLEGLNDEVNFLQDEIPIWNYAAWVDEVEAYIATEIAELRMQMTVNQKLIANTLKRTEEDFANGTYEQLQVDKQFLFNLRKYDLHSVVEPLFRYQEFKHAILHQEHWSKTIDADESTDYDRKMSSYGRMVHNIRRADTVLREALKRDVKGSYAKYNEFIDQYYEGMEGIKTYANLELANNEKDFHHYAWKIQNIALEKYKPLSHDRRLKYGRWDIPDFVMEDNVTSEEDRMLYTTHIVRNLDESEYLGGVFYNKKEEKKSAFVCKKEANGRVSWFKELIMEMDSAGADSHTEIAVLYAAQTGCAFVLNGHMSKPMQK